MALYLRETVSYLVTVAVTNEYCDVQSGECWSFACISQIKIIYSAVLRTTALTDVKELYSYCVHMSRDQQHIWMAFNH